MEVDTGAPVEVVGKGAPSLGAAPVGEGGVAVAADGSPDATGELATGVGRGLTSVGEVPVGEVPLGSTPAGAVSVAPGPDGVVAVGAWPAGTVSVTPGTDG